MTAMAAYRMPDQRPRKEPRGTAQYDTSLGRYGMLEVVPLRMKDSACRISP
jgi:hypothetical protein